MISHDYRKEIGLKSATPMVPLPVAIVALLLGAAGLWFGAMKLHASASGHAAEPAHAAKPAATGGLANN